MCSLVPGSHARPTAPSLFGYGGTAPYEFHASKSQAASLQRPVWLRGPPSPAIHPTGRYVEDKEATQALAGASGESWIETQLQTMDSPSYISTINTPLDKGNTTQLHYLGWAPGFLDASQQMLEFLSSYAPPNGLATRFTTTRRLMPGSARPRKKAALRSAKNSTARSPNRCGMMRPGSFSGCSISRLSILPR